MFDHTNPGMARLKPILFAVWAMLPLFLLLPGISQPSDPGPVMTITTTDSRQVEGTILEGSLTVQSTFGQKKVDAGKIRLFSPAGMNLTDGTIFAGTVTILDGELQVQTAKGVVAIKGRQIHSIQGQGGYLSTAQPAGPSPDDLGEGETRALVLGKWQDSNGMAWEFLKDGTVTQGNAAHRFTFPDHRHLKLHVGSAGVGVGVPGMHGGFMSMGGMSMDRVYEIASISHSRMVFKYGGNDLTFTRTQ